MPLFNLNLGRYSIFVRCDNCGAKIEMRIKRGMRIEDFVKLTECRCNECGCKVTVKEYSTKWIK